MRLFVKFCSLAKKLALKRLIRFRALILGAILNF